MRFIDDGEIPFGVRQFFLVVLVARQLVQAADELVAFFKVVAGGGLFLFFGAEDFKAQTELFPEFVLPLFGERAGGNDEYPSRICTHEQFFNKKPRHDGLARTGVVCQHETQRL